MNKKIIWICGFIIFICILIAVNNGVNKASYGGDSSSLEHSESVSSDRVIQVTSSNFDEVVLNSGKKVLVDFYADWCPPCRALAPLIDEVANESTDENLVFVRLNIDDEEELSNKYGIQSIPTLVLIKNGQEIDRSVGYIEKESILEFINNNR